MEIIRLNATQVASHLQCPVDDVDLQVLADINRHLDAFVHKYRSIDDALRLVDYREKWRLEYTSVMKSNQQSNEE